MDDLQREICKPVLKLDFAGAWYTVYNGVSLRIWSQERRARALGEFTQVTGRTGLELIYVCKRADRFTGT